MKLAKDVVVLTNLLLALSCSLAMSAAADFPDYATKTHTYKPFSILSKNHTDTLNDIALSYAVLCKSPSESLAQTMDLLQNYEVVGSSKADGTMTITTFGGIQDGQVVPVALAIDETVSPRRVSYILVNELPAIACDITKFRRFVDREEDQAVNGGEDDIKINNEDQAFKFLSQLVSQNNYYPNGCISIYFEGLEPDSPSKQYNFVVREKHGGECPGDPETAPVRDRFTVFDNGDIGWYDFEQAGYVDILFRDQVPADVKALIYEYEELNSTCRGGSGDSPETMAACENRDAFYPKIKKRGWCWGKEGQLGYEQRWGKCSK